MDFGSSTNKRIGLWLAAAVLGTSLTAMAPSTGQALPLHDSGLRALAAGQQDVEPAQYRRHYRGGYNRHHRRHYRSNRGVGLGLGLATGAIIGGAIASQGAYARGNAHEYCASKYRSYDPRSRTYLNYDGNRYPCP